MLAAVVVAVCGLVFWAVSSLNSGGTAEVVSEPGSEAAAPERVALEDSFLARDIEAIVALGPRGMPELAPGRSWQPRPVPEPPAGEIVRSAAPLPPDLSAERFVVIDADSGAVLAGHNEHQQAAMASTIKVLTALSVLRATETDEIVTVDATADAVGERGLWLAEGEQHSVHDLLGGMLVGSANDAATALAVHVGGSVAGWADYTNWLARRLGARNTNVVNPHGLDADGHVSSAYDLAVLARAGLSDPVFADWVLTKEHKVPWPGMEYPRVARNKNKLLENYPGALGIKTGGTNKAGPSLVSGAEREGERYVVVVLKSWNPSGESAALLDWAFANHMRVEVVPAGSLVEAKDGDYVAAEAMSVTVPNEQAGAVTTRVRDGRIEAVLGDEVLGSVSARRAS